MKTQTLQGAEFASIANKLVSHLGFQCKAVQKTSLAVAQGVALLVLLLVLQHLFVVLPGFMWCESSLLFCLRRCAY